MGFRYEEFTQILDKHLREKQIERVLKALARSPQRFTGIFRPSTPREKLIQYVIQSREIKFGDAFEEVISEILSTSGYCALPKTLKAKGEGKLACDLLFKSPDRLSVLLVEQKMRDDHDSTKRDGQFKNFERKVKAVRNQYSGFKLHAIMYFVDPEQAKNESYYTSKCNKLKKSLPAHATLAVLYGEEFFNYLEKCISPPCVSWAELEEWLKRWRNTDRTEAPELIDLEKRENLDKVIEIAKRRPELISKIAGERSLWAGGLLKALFPTGDGLREICNSLKEAMEAHKQAASAQTRRRQKRAHEATETYKQAADKLEEYIPEFYSGGNLR